MDNINHGAVVRQWPHVSQLHKVSIITIQDKFKPNRGLPKGNITFNFLHDWRDTPWQGQKRR